MHGCGSHQHTLVFESLVAMVAVAFAVLIPALPLLAVIALIYFLVRPAAGVPGATV